MNYKDLPIIEFMDTILGKRKSQDIEPTISEFDMSDYLENKTSTFSRDKFETLIKVIREHVKSAEYKFKELKEAEKSDDDIYRIKMTGFFAPKFDYEKLFKFSDIAEREYKRVTESTPDETNPILKGIKRPNNTRNVQIALIGLYDFFERLTYDENFVLSDSEMYSYIKYNTDNFDLETFKLFRNELNFLSGSIKFVPPHQITNDNNDEISILEFHEKYIVKPAFDNIEKNKNQNEYIKKLGKYVDLFIKEFDAKMKMQEIQSYFKEYDFRLTEKYSKIIRFSDLVFSLYEKLFTTTHSTLNIIQKTTLDKQPLIFAGLFISPYSEYIDLLLEKLSDIGLIKTNNNWREWETGKVEKNETSKFYYYLKQKNVLNDYDDTPALICFNEKFGIEVYKDKEIPKTERFVQIRSLTSLEKRATKTKLLDKFDIIFSKWIDTIPLK